MYKIYLKNIEETVEKRKELGPILVSNYLSSIIKNEKWEYLIILSNEIIIHFFKINNFSLSLFFKK